MKLNLKSPIAILGFGVEGKKALEYLKENKKTGIVVLDEGSPQIPDKMKQFADFKLGKGVFSDLDRFETIIRSPGVKYNHPEIKKAKELGKVITSMTDLTLKKACKRISAITGSNGKTTTTGLVAEILNKHYDSKLIVGGNDKKPIVSEAEKNPEWPIVMEVSSFQFADMTTSPHISAVLNITPNHMDWHEDLEDYINAKKNLIKHQGKEDWAILNADNENSAKLAEKAPGQVFWINKREGNAWAMWKKKDIIVNNIKIINRDEIKIKTHPDNLLFAVAIAILHDVPVKTITETLKTFESVEHRLEFVREINGVQFYNDSACTTPESAKVAIDQFPEGKVILLLGGSSKKADFDFMASKMQTHTIRAYLYGEEGNRIRKAIEEVGSEELIIGQSDENDFAAIIKDVFKKAKPGDNIVLSPACASFDMFKNSKDRGLKFKEIVKGL